TLAAMLDKINSERHEHMLTVEDPIEYLHQHKKCVVNQREVHADTHSFSNALRAALREDPDVVLIGEMRDLETIESALRLPGTGSGRTRSTRSTPPCRPARRSTACRLSTSAWPASTSRSRSPCRPRSGSPRTRRSCRT